MIFPRILFLALHLIVFFYCLPYLIQILKGLGQADGWHYAVMMVLLDAVLAIVLVYFIWSKSWSNMRELLMWMVLYTLMSFFLGPKIVPKIATATATLGVVYSLIRMRWPSV